MHKEPYIHILGDLQILHEMLSRSMSDLRSEGRKILSRWGRARIKAIESPTIDEFPMRNFIYGGFPVALLDHLW